MLIINSFELLDEKRLDLWLKYLLLFHYIKGNKYCQSILTMIEQNVLYQDFYQVCDVEVILSMIIQVRKLHLTISITNSQLNFLSRQKTREFTHQE